MGDRFISKSKFIYKIIVNSSLKLEKPITGQNEGKKYSTSDEMIFIRSVDTDIRSINKKSVLTIPKKSKSLFDVWQTVLPVYFGKVLFKVT